MNKPPYHLDKITEIYAFVAENEDGEGIIARVFDINDRPTYVPFVCVDKERMESLKTHAKDIGKKMNKKIKLIKFTQREEIEEYTV